MAAGLGAESLAAKFKQGGALGTYRAKWLLVEAADTATEGGLAKNHGILLLRAIVGEPLHMDGKKNRQFTSFEQRNRELEKEVKDLERWSVWLRRRSMSSSCTLTCRTGTPSGASNRLTPSRQSCQLRPRRRRLLARRRPERSARR